MSVKKKGSESEGERETEGKGRDKKGKKRSYSDPDTMYIKHNWRCYSRKDKVKGEEEETIS